MPNPTPKVYKLQLYGTKYNIVLGKANYIDNNTIAVLMYESTPKGKVKDFFGDLTVNINDSNLMANSTDTQFIDTNNLGYEIIKWLVDNNIAKAFDILGFSGFCTYPLVEFTKEAIDGMFTLE